MQIRQNRKRGNRSFLFFVKESYVVRGVLGCSCIWPDLEYRPRGSAF